MGINFLKQMRNIKKTNILCSILILYGIFLKVLCTTTTNVNNELAVRVARFSIHYAKAEVEKIFKVQHWPIIMRKSVLASLRFVNKHWLICGESESIEK